MIIKMTSTNTITYIHVCKERYGFFYGLARGENIYQGILINVMEVGYLISFQRASIYTSACVISLSCSSTNPIRFFLSSDNISNGLNIG